MDQLDLEAAWGDSRNVVIVYFVALWFCMALYRKADMFDYQSTSNVAGYSSYVTSVLDLLGGQVLDHEDELPSHSSNDDRSNPIGGKQPLDGEKSKESRQGFSVPSAQGKRPVPATESSLMEVLNEAIDAPRRCLHAEEQLVAALERYKSATSN